jgi:hypothetical protein
MKKLSTTLVLLFLSCTLLFAQKEIRQTVHYDFGSATLIKSDKQKLDSLVDVLKDYSDFVIHLKGHTDDVGSTDNNGDLSTNRCYSVRTYLISKNVPANMITVESFGESKPATTNNSPEGRAQNRRVEIVAVVNRLLQSTRQMEILVVALVAAENPRLSYFLWDRAQRAVMALMSLPTPLRWKQ